jgi:hypothetical protein
LQHIYVKSFLLLGQDIFYMHIARQGHWESLPLYQLKKVKINY